MIYFFLISGQVSRLFYCIGIHTYRCEVRGEADKFGKLDILNGPGKIPVLDLKPCILEEHQAAVSSSSAN